MLLRPLTNLSKKTRKRVSFILLLLGLLVLAGCQKEQNAWDHVQESGVLRVGLDPTYPPFESLVGEDVDGIDVDLTRAIAQQLGLTVEYVYFGYDGLYDALATQQVDILASALVIAPDKLRDFEYSQSYFNAGQVFVSPIEAPISTPDDLEDKDLAVELGAQGHVEALGWQRRYERLDILPYHSADEAIISVVNKEADGAVVDQVSARLFAGLEVDSLIVSDPVTDEPYSLVVNTGEDELLEAIDGAMEDLEGTGEIQAILDRWFLR